MKKLTLIEFMIIISVVGILAAIIVPNCTGKTHAPRPSHSRCK